MNVKDIEKGDRLVEAAGRAPNACLIACDHKACNRPAETYEVTGKRRAPKGERVYLRHPHGWGCAIVADADGNLDPKWTKAIEEGPNMSDELKLYIEVTVNRGSATREQLEEKLDGVLAHGTVRDALEAAGLEIAAIHVLDAQLVSE